MDNKRFLQNDLIDLIFEKRNKNYGAYNLRKFYKNRLFKSLFITLGSAVLLCGFTLITGNKKKPEEKIMVWEYPALAPVKKEEKKVIKPAVKKIAAPRNSSIIKTLPVIIKDSTKIVPIDWEKNANSITNQDFLESGDAVVQQSELHNNSGTQLTDVTAVKPNENDEPLEKASVMPAYPGGMEALTKFLKRNLINPRDMEVDEQISVKVKFIVGVDGKPKNYAVVQDGGEEFNQEVLRVLKKMPPWIPGKDNGKNVAVYYVIPVKFVGE